MKAPKYCLVGGFVVAGASSTAACSNIADDCNATRTCPSGGRTGASGGSAAGDSSTPQGGESSSSGGGSGSEGGRSFAGGTGGAAKGGNTSSGGNAGDGGDATAGEAGGGTAGTTFTGGNAGSGGTFAGGASSTGGSQGGTVASGGVGGRGGTSANGGSGGASGGKGGGGGTAGTAGTGAGGKGGSGGSAQCGNGKLETGEDCDDYNIEAGDGCGATCRVETDWVCPGGSAAARSVCNRSCADMTGKCLAGDCCESPLVAGGTFQQGEPDEFASTVSDFRLDRYEVTVGRFRKFVNGYEVWRSGNKPAAGEGANVNVTGSGWNTEWSSNLPNNSARLISNLKCDSYPTWLDGSGNDTLPINCVNWFEAFAFCIWDGARLPTEAEWEYAAAGGSNDSKHPWGNTPVLDDTAATANLAVYNCLVGGDAGDCSFADILPVGSKPDGQGLYLQRDLLGSMSEWTLDWNESYPTVARNNYAKIDSGSYRVNRGGDWNVYAWYLTSAYRNAGTPMARSNNGGFRCARTR